MYMRNQTSQFCDRFQDFQHFGLLFCILFKPESSEDLNLSEFKWMDTEDFPMLLIDFDISA